MIEQRNDLLRQKQINTYHSVPSTSKTMPFKGGAFESLLLLGSRGAKRFGALLCVDMILIGRKVGLVYEELEKREGMSVFRMIMNEGGGGVEKLYVRCGSI